MYRPPHCRTKAITGRIAHRSPHLLAGTIEHVDLVLRWKYVAHDGFGSLRTKRPRFRVGAPDPDVDVPKVTESRIEAPRKRSRSAA